MSFNITHRDITQEKVDVIVNSLGIVTNHYGAICYSILAASKSPILRKEIDDHNGKVGIGDVFITDSYGLPCKKIAHLVTPFYDYDKEYVVFETAIRDLLNTCRTCGYKTISIPILGTGANGYDSIQIKSILFSMCSGFTNAYKDIDITIVLKPFNQKAPDWLDKDSPFDEEFERAHRDAYAFECAMHNYIDKKKKMLIREEREYDLKFFEECKPILPMGWTKTDIETNRLDVVFSNEEVKKMDLDDYVEMYLKKRYGNNWGLIDKAKKKMNTFMGRGNSTKGSKYFYAMSTEENKVPNRINMFRIALALEMSTNEANYFFNVFGITPSRKVPLELCLMNCIYDNIYDINGIESVLNKRKLGSLFD